MLCIFVLFPFSMGNHSVGVSFRIRSVLRAANALLLVVLRRPHSRHLKNVVLHRRFFDLQLYNRTLRLRIYDNKVNLLQCLSVIVLTFSCSLLTNEYVAHSPLLVVIVCV